MKEYTKEQIQKLVDNFYEACSLCDELDVYEHPELDQDIQEITTWTDENFGRKIK